MLDPGRAALETIELDKAVGVALEWAQRRGNDDTLIIVTADHETAGLAIAGFWDGSKIVYTGFPDYPDADKDGFPDSLRIDRPLIFENARTNPPAETPPTTPSRALAVWPRPSKDS